MKYNMKLTKYTFKLILRDNILFIMLLAPIICGIAFKYFIPILDEFISFKLHSNLSISPYYQVFDLVLVYLSPSFICTIAGFIMLEELDENIWKYLFITPYGKNGYLLARLVIPSIFAFLFSLLSLMLFSLTNITFFLAFAMAFFSTLNAIAMALIVVTKANNKVEGLAWTKLVNMNIIFMIAPYFIPGKYKYIFAIFPSYWIADTAINYYNEDLLISILFGIIVLGFWIKYFYLNFNKKFIMS